MESTDHETRARNAKAQALATVLAETEAIDDPGVVHRLTVADWEVAAAAATARGLLGTDGQGRNRTVHPPHSERTVHAVAAKLMGIAAAGRVVPMRPKRDAGRIPTARRATDSAGYRAALRPIAPVPEDPFAGFPR